MQDVTADNNGHGGRFSSTVYYGIRWCHLNVPWTPSSLCILWACCSLEILDHNSNTMVWHTCCFPGTLELGLHYGSPWIISPHPETDSTTAWAEIWIHGGQSCGSGLRDSHCLTASCGGAKMTGVGYTQRIGAAEWGGVRLLRTGVEVTGPMQVRQTRNS